MAETETERGAPPSRRRFEILTLQVPEFRVIHSGRKCVPVRTGIFCEGVKRCERAPDAPATNPDLAVSGECCANRAGSPVDVANNRREEQVVMPEPACRVIQLSVGVLQEGHRDAGFQESLHE